MLDFRRDIDDVTGLEFSCRFSPFLIPAAAGRDDQNLAAARFCMMDVPVIAAARLKGHIADINLLLVQGLDQMAPVPFQVAEARLIVGQCLVLCLAFRRAASVKEFIIHVFRSFPLLMLLS